MEFKLRAWDKRHEKMGEVKAWSSFNGGELTIRRHGENASYVIQADDVILMQSTGLFDKDGIEIFEGDIVNAYDIETNDFEEFKITSLTGVVTYHKNAFALEKENVFNDLWVCAEHYKVIGNIYENPDLIESVEV
ncbi:YopX family protein [Streptococcus phocae]|uniref:YopX family protein n=1 Tax=Streptococcus phocae TaxID=119224 RepID=UPI0006BBB6AD|nr:YopX family protein [Streptococcus phocae]